MTPLETLNHIQQHLTDGHTPQQLIEELSPRTRTDAFQWISRLPTWGEYSDQFPGQVIAIARVIGHRAKRAFSLKLSEDGRVIDSAYLRPTWQTPRPSKRFKLLLNGEEIRVEYTPAYFPDGQTDLLYFVSPHTPVQPHALSETGYWSKLTPHDQIIACGGPEAFAALLAEAQLRGESKEFEAAFEGKRPEKPQQGKKPPAPIRKQPHEQIVGKHTAHVVQEEQPLTQKSLFEGMP